MPNLFHTFSRAALVAIGLSLAPAAFAQGTFNVCPTGFTPIFTGVGTQSLEATCGVSCPSGQTASVNGNTVSCSGGTPVDVVPAGCKLTASPTSGSTATNVTLTLSCTSGTLPIDVAWSGGVAPGNCPSSMDALSKPCTVTGVAQTTTWTVSQFSNSVGNGNNNNNKSATFTFQQGGGGGFASCPSGAVTVSNGWSSNLSLSFSDGQIYSFEMPVSATAGTSLKRNDWSYYAGGSGSYEYTITTTACDFSGATDVFHVDALGNLKTSKAHYYDSDGLFTFYYKVGKNLTAGQTYYFNIKASCGSCGELGTLLKP